MAKKSDQRSPDEIRERSLAEIRRARLLARAEREAEGLKRAADERGKLRRQRDEAIAKLRRQLNEALPPAEREAANQEAAEHASRRAILRAMVEEMPRSERTSWAGQRLAKEVAAGIPDLDMRRAWAQRMGLDWDDRTLENPARLSELPLFVDGKLLRPTGVVPACATCGGALEVGAPPCQTCGGGLEEEVDAAPRPPRVVGLDAMQEKLQRAENERAVRQALIDHGAIWPRLTKQERDGLLWLRFWLEGETPREALEHVVRLHGNTQNAAATTMNVRRFFERLRIETPPELPGTNLREVPRSRRE